MPDDYKFHEYRGDFQPVNGDEILSLSGLIANYGTRQVNGVTTSHVEGGVLNCSDNSQLDFYIMGYNGYSSDGMLRFMLVPDGQTTVYDACFKECKEDNCYYGAYYSVDVSGEKNKVEFGGLARFVDPNLYCGIINDKMGKAISSFVKRNRTIYPKTVEKLNERMTANLCDHDDREEKIETAKAFFRARLVEDQEHKKEYFPRYMLPKNGEK